MAIYYVDGAVGNDSNTGTSPGPGNAWKSIQRSATIMLSGDLCYVKAGTYGEQIAFAATGTTSSPLIWRGYFSIPGDLDVDGGVYTGSRIGHASRPIITGGNSRSYCFALAATVAYHQFHNFVLTSPTAAIIGRAGGSNAIQFWNTRLTRGSANVPLEALTSSFGDIDISTAFCDIDGLNSVLNIHRAFACEIHDLVGNSSSFALAVGDFRNRDYYYNTFYNLPGGGITFASTDSSGIVLGNTFNQLGSHAIQGVGRSGNNNGNTNLIFQNLVSNVNGRPINWSNGSNPSYVFIYGGTAYHSCTQPCALPSRSWQNCFILGADRELSDDPFQALGSGNFNVATAEAFQHPFPPGWPRGVMNSTRPFGASIGPAPGGSTLILVED